MSSGDEEKWMDSRERVGKCLSTLGDVLGVGGKGERGFGIASFLCKVCFGNWEGGCLEVFQGL